MESGNALRDQVHADMTWSRILARAAAGDHVSSDILARAVEQFGAALSPEARSYVAQRLRGEIALTRGRQKATALELLRELLYAQERERYVSGWEQRLARLRVSKPCNLPRQRRPGRVKLLDKSLDWKRTERGQYRVATPRAAALRWACRTGPAANALAAALDDVGHDLDWPTRARDHRIKWEAESVALADRIKEGLSRRHAQKFNAAVQRERTGLVTPPADGSRTE